MEIPMQIDQISVSRASNAAHFEYMESVRKRTEALPMDNVLWRRAVEEFGVAFKREDEAFKQYRASDRTAALREADEERDKMYASLRDTIKAYANFPIPETAQHAEPLLKVIKNYKIDTSVNYMKESGLIDNMLQDLLQYSSQLRRLGLEILANRLREANDRVRQLLSERNEERSGQVIGELKAARQTCDAAYAVVVFYTNAYFALNPDRPEAADLVKHMAEDLEYFRRHAMSNPNKNKTKLEADESTPQDDATPTEG